LEEQKGADKNKPIEERPKRNEQPAYIERSKSKE